MPLAREVCAAHAAGLVAPLDGIDDLAVEGVRIWFAQAKGIEPRRPSAEVNRIERDSRAAVEIVAEQRVTTDVDEGKEQVVDLAIGDPESVTRPVYLPGYQSWEHRLACHDPLSDVFSLGMILASLACGLDFCDPESLATFVECRKEVAGLGLEYTLRTRGRPHEGEQRTTSQLHAFCRLVPPQVRRSGPAPGDNGGWEGRFLADQSSLDRGKPGRGETLWGRPISALNFMPVC